MTRCAYPFLPLSHRPSPKVYWVGLTTTFRSTTSERGGLTRLQSFVDLQASEFAATQIVPTAGHLLGTRAAVAFYVRANRGSLPPRASDMLAVRNRAIDGRGLSPPRSAALPAATRLSPPILCRLNWRTQRRVMNGSQGLKLIPHFFWSARPPARNVGSIRWSFLRTEQKGEVFSGPPPHRSVFP